MIQFDGKEMAPPLSEVPSGEIVKGYPRVARGCREATGAYDTNLTVTGAYDHFAGSVICANIYIIAYYFYYYYYFLLFSFVLLFFFFFLSL